MDGWLVGWLVGEEVIVTRFNFLILINASLYSEYKFLLVKSPGGTQIDHDYEP